MRGESVSEHSSWNPKREEAVLKKETQVSEQTTREHLVKLKGLNTSYSTEESSYPVIFVVQTIQYHLV